MKTLRQLIGEVRLPTAKGELDFYKAHVDNTEVVDDPDNKDNPNNPLKKLPKTYTGLDPKGGRVAEAVEIKEEAEFLSEDEMARRAYVYERIFTLIDDITSIVDEFYTEEKDYENAINKRSKAYRENPDKDPKIPYPDYPTRPWSIANTARVLDELYQELLGNTNRDVDHVYEEVSLVEMKKPELFKKANVTIEAQQSLKTETDKSGVQDATGSDTADYAEETQIDEISSDLVRRYRAVAKGDRDYNKGNKAHADHNHDKPDTGPGAKAHYKKVSDASDKKIKKREKGIAAADKRIGEEVEQIDELSSETKNTYVQKALADRTTADKEARMNISGAKKVGVADPKEGRRLLAIAKSAAARRDKRTTGIARAKKDDA